MKVKVIMPNGAAYVEPLAAGPIVISDGCRPARIVLRKMGKEHVIHLEVFELRADPGDFDRVAGKIFRVGAGDDGRQRRAVVAAMEVLAEVSLVFEHVGYSDGNYLEDETVAVARFRERCERLAHS